MFDTKLYNELRVSMFNFINYFVLWGNFNLYTSKNLLHCYLCWHVLNFEFVKNFTSIMCISALFLLQFDFCCWLRLKVKLQCIYDIYVHINWKLWKKDWKSPWVNLKLYVQVWSGTFLFYQFLFVCPMQVLTLSNMAYFYLRINIYWSVWRHRTTMSLWS